MWCFFVVCILYICVWSLIGQYNFLILKSLFKICIISCSDDGNKCAYVFKVSSVLECPSLFATNTMFAPLDISKLAWLCLKSCKRIIFVLDLLQYVTNFLFMVDSDNGVSPLNKNVSVCIVGTVSIYCFSKVIRLSGKSIFLVLV